jgi:hypothetical protein
MIRSIICKPTAVASWLVIGQYAILLPSFPRKLWVNQLLSTAAKAGLRATLIVVVWTAIMPIILSTESLDQASLCKSIGNALFDLVRPLPSIFASIYPPCPLAETPA